MFVCRYGLTRIWMVNNKREREIVRLRTYGNSLSMDSAQIRVFKQMYYVVFSCLQQRIKMKLKPKLMNTLTDKSHHRITTSTQEHECVAKIAERIVLLEGLLKLPPSTETHHLHT